MGCDIHCMVEKKLGDVWIKIDGFESDYYTEGHEYFGKDEYKSGTTPVARRNYRMFAVMADVRNGYGFAGCDTGDAVEPISHPKGVPEDASDEYLEMVRQWGGCGHSHSWLTAKEIQERKDQKHKTVCRGWVSPAQYKVFKEKGSPESYSGGVSGPGIKHVSNEEMEQHLSTMDPAKLDKEGPGSMRASVYTKVEWSQDETDACGSLFDHALPQLMERSIKGDGSDVRLVFFFDN